MPCPGFPHKPLPPPPMFLCILYSGNRIVNAHTPFLPYMYKSYSSGGNPSIAPGVRPARIFIGSIHLILVTQRYEPEGYKKHTCGRASWYSREKNYDEWISLNIAIVWSKAVGDRNDSPRFIDVNFARICSWHVQALVSNYQFDIFVICHHWHQSMNNGE